MTQERDQDEYLLERTADLPDLDPPKDEKIKRKNKKEDEIDRARRLTDAYGKTLMSYDGRMVLCDRLDKMGYWNIPYDPTSPHHTAYLVGCHAMAVELYEALWAISPEHTLQMIRENRT